MPFSNGNGMNLLMAGKPFSSHCSEYQFSFTVIISEHTVTNRDLFDRANTVGRGNGRSLRQTAHIGINPFVRRITKDLCTLSHQVVDIVAPVLDRGIP